MSDIPTLMEFVESLPDIPKLAPHQVALLEQIEEARKTGSRFVWMNPQRAGKRMVAEIHERYLAVLSGEKR